MKTIDQEDITASQSDMIQAAIRIREFAYTPFSHFKVGAAVMATDGSIFSGCNVETSDYTGTTHAEGLAIDSMVKEGKRKLISLAIAMNAVTGMPVPCGLCRQKISEFGRDESIPIFMANLDEAGEIEVIYMATLNELLPHSFSAKHFKRELDS